MNSKKGLTRRQFNLSMAALGGAALLPGRMLDAFAAKGANPAKTRVILVRDQVALDENGKTR